MTETSKQNLVRDRLHLAKWILEKSEELRDPSLIEDLEDGGWSHPYIQNDALVSYLLLTCFDLLGQPSEWMNFNVWLSAKRTKEEREKVIASIPKNATKILIAKEIYKSYLELYGTKKSFYRFIEQVLDVDSCKELMASVRIMYKEAERQQKKLDDDAKKKKFLYESRNLFTHDAIPTGSVIGGISPKLVILRGDRMQWGFQSIRIKKEYEFSVRRWPFILFEIISKEINEPMNDFNVEFEVMVEMEKGPGICISGIKDRDLHDRKKLREMAEKYSQDRKLNK